jgi:hypothetical protein
MDEKEIEKATDYAYLEGSEVGDVMRLLISLHGFGDYMSDEMFDALEHELRGHINWFDVNMKIVEREVVTTNKVRELVDR